MCGYSLDTLAPCRHNQTCSPSAHSNRHGPFLYLFTDKTLNHATGESQTNEDEARSREELCNLGSSG